MKKSLSANKPQQSLLNGAAFHSLSSFYTSLWSYINTFFSDNRWMNPYPAAQDELYRLFQHSLERIQREEIDGVTYKQVMQDFHVIEELRESLPANDGEPDAQWIKRADKMRHYSQELGLRYAEMAAESSH